MQISTLVIEVSIEYEARDEKTFSTKDKFNLFLFMLYSLAVLNDEITFSTQGCTSSNLFK